MLYTYQCNIINYNDAFFLGIKNIHGITGIGFPIPEKFIDQIKNTIENKLIQNSMIEDGVFEVTVVPAEYTMVGGNGNVGKPSYSYQIEVELKRKVILIMQKQKNVYKQLKMCYIKLAIYVFI